MAHDEFGSDFTEHSISEILEGLKNEVKGRGLWSDFLEGSIGGNLLEVIATFLAKHKTYQTILARQAFPTKASLRSAVLEGFEILNYDPDRREWADVDLRFYLDSAHSTDIVIPRYTSVQHDGSGKTFLTLQRAVINSGDTEVKVKSAQGSLSTIDRTSEGQENMEIHVPSDIVAEDGLEVLVDEDGDGFELEDEWQEVDSLLTALSDTDEYRAYKVEARTDETLDVIFGDDIQGKVPESGDPIRINYIETLGSDGSVTESDSITNLQDEIQDIAGNSVDVSVTNDGRSATGGADKPTLEEIKAEAPEIFSVGESAVTREDYRVIAEDQPSVLLANAVGERNSNPPNADFADTLDIFVIRERDQNGDPQPVTAEWAGTSGDGTLENPNDGSFLWELRRKSMLNAVNDVKEAGKVWFIVEGTAYVDPSIEPSKVLADVKSELKDFLLAENNPERNIGNPLRESDMEERIGSIEEIDYHHFKYRMYAEHEVTTTNLDLTAKEFETQSNAYEIATPVKPFSVEIYDASGTLILTDDGNGGFNTENGFSNFSSGSITYDPNQGNTFVSLTLTTEPDEIWEFSFRSQDPESGKNLEDGDILVSDGQYGIFDSGRVSENVSIEFNFQE